MQALIDAGWVGVSCCDNCDSAEEKSEISMAALHFSEVDTFKSVMYSGFKPIALGPTGQKKAAILKLIEKLS